MLSAAIVIAYGCSSPTKPKDSDTNTTGGQTVVIRNVDANGGTLASEDIVITIPQGALNESKELSIAECDDISPVVNQVTGTYSLSGVPRDFSRNIDVKIKYNGELSENNFMVIRWDTATIADDSTYSVHEIVEAEAENGFLAASIPASLNFSSAAKRAVDLSQVTINVFGISNYIGIQNGGRFRLIFPAENLLFAKGLSDALDEAYDDILSYGFQYNHQASGKAELRNILVSPNIFDDDVSYYDPITAIVPDTSANLPPQLIYKDKTLSSLFDSNDRLAAHTAFFRLAQRLYKTNYDDGFLNYSAEGWLRKRFSTVQPYTPPGFTKAPLTVLKGIIPNLYDVSSQEYGDAVSPFIQYLHNRIDMQKNLGVIYDNLLKGKYYTETISELLGEDERAWWPDFLKEFITGSIYDIDASTIVTDTNTAGVFAASSADTLKTFTEDYSPFQARLYKISVTGELAGQLDYIRLTMTCDDVDDSYLKAMAFGMKNGRLAFIGSDTDIGVSDIDNYSDTGILYVLAVNCAVLSPVYTSIRDASLTVEAVKKPLPVQSEQNTLSFSASVFGTFLSSKTNFDDEIVQYDLSPLADPWITEGILDGRTFTGNTSVTENGTTKDISVIVTFNESFDRIESFTFSGNFTSASSSTYSESMSVTGGDIPFSSTYLGWRIFTLRGKDACGGITGMEYQSESSRTVLDTVITTTRKMQSFECSDKSKIEIQIKPK